MALAAQTKIVFRLRNLQFFKEDLAHVLVKMLASMHDNFFDRFTPGTRGDFAAYRTSFNELGTCTHDRNESQLNTSS